MASSPVSKPKGSHYKCNYSGCETTKHKNPLLHFFKFPTNRPAILEQWLVNCGNEKLIDLPDKTLGNKKVCEKHFTIDDFTNNTKKYLKKDAVPTAFVIRENENDEVPVSLPEVDPSPQVDIQELPPPHLSHSLIEPRIIPSSSAPRTLRYKIFRSVLNRTPMPQKILSTLMKRKLLLKLKFSEKKTKKFQTRMRRISRKRKQLTNEITRNRLVVDKEVASKLDYSAMSSNMLKAKARRSQNSTGVIDVENQDCSGVVETQDIAGPSNIIQPSNVQSDVPDTFNESLESQLCSSKSNIQFDARDILTYQDMEFGTLKESGMGHFNPTSTIREEESISQPRDANQDDSKVSEKNKGDAEKTESSEKDTETTSNVILSEMQTTSGDVVACEDVVFVDMLKSSTSIDKPDDPKPTNLSSIKSKSNNGNLSALPKSKLDNGAQTHVTKPTDNGSQPLVTKPKSVNHAQSKDPKVKVTRKKASTVQYGTPCIVLEKSKTDIYFQKLETSISRMENASSKFLAATLTDQFDQFAKYLSTLLRGLPSKKVLSVKKAVVSEVLQALYEEQEPKSGKAVGVQTDFNVSCNTFQETNISNSTDSSLPNCNTPVSGVYKKCSYKRSNMSSSNKLYEKKIATGGKINTSNFKKLSASTSKISSSNNIRMLSSISSVSMSSIPSASNNPMYGGNMSIVSSGATTAMPILANTAQANVSTVATTQAPIMSLLSPNSYETINTVAQTAEGTLIAVTIQKPKDPVPSSNSDSTQPALLAPKQGQKRMQPMTATDYSCKRRPNILKLSHLFPSANGSSSPSTNQMSSCTENRTQLDPVLLYQHQVRGKISTVIGYHQPVSQMEIISPSQQRNSGQVSGSPGTRCYKPVKQMEIISPRPSQQHGTFTDVVSAPTPTGKNSGEMYCGMDAEGGLEIKQEHEYFEAVLCEEGSNDFYIKEEVIDLEDVHKLPSASPPSALEKPICTDEGMDPTSALDPLSTPDMMVPVSSTPEMVLLSSLKVVSTSELVVPPIHQGSSREIIPTPFVNQASISLPPSVKVTSSVRVVTTPSLIIDPTKETFKSPSVNQGSATLLINPTSSVVLSPSMNAPSSVEVVPPQTVKQSSSMEVIQPVSTNTLSTVEVDPSPSVNSYSTMEVIPPPSDNQFSSSETISSSTVNHTSTNETILPPSTN